MIYNEDCFNTMKRLHNQIDIVLTSPPYNTSKKIHTKKHLIIMIVDMMNLMILEHHKSILIGQLNYSIATITF